MLARAHGHTYGCHNVWQMYEPSKRQPISHARTPWREALKLPGASQMRYVKALMLSRPPLLRVPDQSLIASDVGKGGEHIRAARGADGSYAFIYLPIPKPVTVNLENLSGKRLRAWWFNPRDVQAQVIGEFARNGERMFTPPSGDSPEEDWVLVLDEVGNRYRKPSA